MPTVVNLDGRLVEPAEARVSVFDRGFLQGDSIYEVLRTYGGHLFEPAAHLARLARSAARARLDLPWSAERCLEELARTVKASLGGDPADAEAAPWNVGERSVRVVMTRGGGEAAPDVPPAAVVIAERLAAPPHRAYRDGVALVAVEVDRSADDPTVKTGARLGHAHALRLARAAGAHEALFADARGLISEGTSSNVFLVRRGQLATPPIGSGLLEGVTRGLVLRLAHQEGIPVAEAPLHRADLASADELFVTSTGREILPAASLDGRAVGGGRPGPVTQQLHAAFRRLADAAARGG